MMTTTEMIADLTTAIDTLSLLRDELTCDDLLSAERDALWTLEMERLRTMRERIRNRQEDSRARLGRMCVSIYEPARDAAARVTDPVTRVVTVTDESNAEAPNEPGRVARMRVVW